MAEYGDYDSQRTMKNAAFRSGKPLDEARLFAFSHVRESPLYDPSFGRHRAIRQMKYRKFIFP